ncbi:hypothetical protein Asp14428_20890 [Actinoplanes sp. NBRC 14428]|nr:hypothetical protein Asp14428_20890 [Actinoplanes sp. NBRC 14428]
MVTVLLQGPDDLSSLPPHTPARTTVAGDTSSSESASALPATSGATGTAPAPGTAPTTAAPGAGPSAPLLPPTSSRPTERATVPSAVALTARYSAANGTGLLGYRAEVAVANPGTAGHDGWELTLTLPRPTLQIAAVSGATARQDGATWTFAPDATTRSVPAGARSWCPSRSGAPPCWTRHPRPARSTAGAAPASARPIRHRHEHPSVAVRRPHFPPAG